MHNPRPINVATLLGNDTVLTAPYRLLTDRHNCVPISLVVLALLHGLLYMLLIPPWQHYDEPGHFEYVRMVALLNRQPGFAEFDTTTNREIGDSKYRFEFYSDPAIRPDVFGSQPQVIGINQHLSPPLYYALAAIPVRATLYLGVEQQLYAARLMSVFFYIFTILIAWRVTVVVVPDEPIPQLAIPLMLLFTPTFVDIMTAVNSDVVLNFAGVAVCLGGVMLIRDGPRPTSLAILCLALTVALLTKRTAVALVIPSIVALIWAFRRRPLPGWPTALFMSGLTIALLVSAVQVSVIDGWFQWELRQWLLTLDRYYLRLDIIAFIRSVSDIEATKHVYAPVSWIVFTSFWSHMGWGHIRLGLVAEIGMLCLVVAGGCGLLLLARSNRAELPLWQKRCIWLFFIFVVVGWIVTIMRVHPIVNDPGVRAYIPRGRYIFWAMLPSLWLLALGIQGLLPTALRRFGLLIPVIALLVLDVVVWAVVLVRFYYA